MSVAKVHGLIRAAVRERLVDLQTAHALPASADWEGEGFTPVTKVPFFRERLHPVASTPRGLGSGGAIAHRALSIITLFYPAGEGTIEIEQAAGDLMEAFPPGSSLIAGEMAATIMQAERSRADLQPDWLALPVTITTIAYTAA